MHALSSTPASGCVSLVSLVHPVSSQLPAPSLPARRQPCLTAPLFRPSQQAKHAAVHACQKAGHQASRSATGRPFSVSACLFNLPRNTGFGFRCEDHACPFLMSLEREGFQPFVSPALAGSEIPHTVGLTRTNAAARDARSYQITE
ncbi:uncharacterized protein PG986_015114 [Apiospora aurea]|uniref:Uncharacterized protein n=1 Tax=Apiospora aurea TaxID=335848 RepID=A0ABR1PRN1_9PEZI